MLSEKDRSLESEVNNLIKKEGSNTFGTVFLLLPICAIGLG